MLAQDREPKIPVLNMVDAKLFAGELDGFRYADMPDDRGDLAPGGGGARRRRRQHGVDRLRRRVARTSRTRVVEAFAKGELHGEVWDELPPARPGRW